MIKKFKLGDIVEYNGERAEITGIWNLKDNVYYTIRIWERNLIFVEQDKLKRVESNNGTERKEI